jgi:hypothetical protein
MKNYLFFTILFLLASCKSQCYSEAIVISDHPKISVFTNKTLDFQGKRICLSFAKDMDNLEIDSKIIVINWVNDSICAVTIYEKRKEETKRIGYMGEMSIKGDFSKQDIDEFLLLIYLKAWYPVDS